MRSPCDAKVYRALLTRVMVFSIVLTGANFPALISRSVVLPVRKTPRGVAPTEALTGQLVAAGFFPGFQSPLHVKVNHLAVQQLHAGLSTAKSASALLLLVGAAVLAYDWWQPAWHGKIREKDLREIEQRRRLLQQLHLPNGPLVASIGPSGEYFDRKERGFPEEILSAQWERLFLEAGAKVEVFDREANDEWKEWAESHASSKSPGQVIVHPRPQAYFDRSSIPDHTLDIAVLMSVLCDNDTMSRDEREALLEAVVTALRPDGHVILGWYNMIGQRHKEQRETERIVDRLRARGWRFVPILGGEGWADTLSHDWVAYRVIQPEHPLPRRDRAPWYQRWLSRHRRPVNLTLSAA